MLQITVNTSAFNADIQRLIRETPAAVHNGVEAAANVMLQECDDQLDRLIYSQPIPMRKNGNPCWVRTNQLREGEKIDWRSKFQAAIDNDTPYALYRHNLNRPSPIDGITRYAPWRQESVTNGAQKAQKAFEQAIKDTLQI